MEKRTSILGITTEIFNLKIFWFINLEGAVLTPMSLAILKFYNSSETFSILKRKL